MINIKYSTKHTVWKSSKKGNTVGRDKYIIYLKYFECPIVQKNKTMLIKKLSKKQQQIKQARQPQRISENLVKVQ